MIASDCFKGYFEKNYKNMWRQKYKKMRLKFENYINRPKYFLQNLSKNPRHQNKKKKDFAKMRWQWIDVFLWNGWPKKKRSVLFAAMTIRGGPQHRKPLIWIRTYKETEFRICSMKLCKSDNYYMLVSDEVCS